MARQGRPVFDVWSDAFQPVDISFPSLFLSILNYFSIIFFGRAHDFEKQKAAKVWEFILDHIVTCDTPKDVPTLEELSDRVKRIGLL